MISFFVPGVPVPKGSAKAFLSHSTKKITVRQDNVDAQKPWASMVGYAAKQAMCEVSEMPVSIEITFYLPRPKGHFGTGKNSTAIKEYSPKYHTVKPDLDKLTRCVCDALTGIAWADDSQVYSITATKRYDTDADPRESGALIRIFG